MEIWQGLGLGIIQGATEFLPISSSGHLFLAESWLGLSPNQPFTIWLHAASLLAVVLIYRRDIGRMIHGALIYFQQPAHRYWQEGQLAWQLALATLCTVVVALVIEPHFERLLQLPWVAGTLIITGVLILVAEKFRRRPPSRAGENLQQRTSEDSRLLGKAGRESEGTQKTRETDFSWTIAIVLGIMQGFAVIPGISRSGLTIALLIFLGLNRQQSARISFLLSIPTILGALVFSLRKEWGSLALSAASLAGCLASFITAVLAIYWMRSLVERHWIWFAPYCLALGGGIWLWLLL